MNNTQTLFTPGRPSLIVPLTGRNHQELQSQISAIPPEADLVEWRIDQFSRHDNPVALQQIATEIAPQIGFPWLATCRTIAQGGASHLEAAQQLQAVKLLVEAGAFALDIEDDFSLVTEALAYAHDQGIISVLSRHYFAAAEAEKMDSERIYDWLAAAHERGAQVAKLALTVTNSSHLLQIFSAMDKYYRDTDGKRPFIVAGMGTIGIASRLIGGIFGNCATFAALPGTAPSAPGQASSFLTASVLSVLEK